MKLALRFIAGIPVACALALFVVVVSPLIVVFLVCEAFMRLADFAFTGRWDA